MAFALFRILAAIAAFQLAGLGHLAGDLVEEMTLGHHHDTSHEDGDDTDHDCPPGCPTCHHVHHGAAPVPSAAVADALCPPIAILFVPISADDRAPLSPALPTVYRPPRV